MIAYCGCVKATFIFVHCGTASTSQAANPKPRAYLNFAEATRGAEAQDQMYGRGNRVHNPLPKKPQQEQRARCTVCGTTRSV